VEQNRVDPETSLASRILQEQWGIHEHVEKTDLGVSRKTWRVGQGYSLSQAALGRLEPFVRESEFLRHLHQFLRSESFSIEVPEIVPDQWGRLVVDSSGWAWRLTRQLAGVHPDSQNPQIYSPIIEGLTRFHRAMRRFSQQISVAIPMGVCLKTRELIQRFQSMSWSPFTGDQEEQELLERTCSWLLPRLDRFESLPRQLTHGDWTPRNVLFDSFAPIGRLAAVLDLESIAIDPIQADLSHTCSTLLMWSGLDRVEARIQDIASYYAHLTKTQIELTDVHTAMLTHWFCHYWSWRDRLETGAQYHEVTKRLSLRIRLVLQFLEGSEGVSS
jgi:Ser/Thr protein kinase RdoA (MazF antagonist)